MSVFKATLAILRKNIGPFLLTFAISLVISVAYSSTIPPEETTLEKMTIVIFNKDESKPAKALVHYLNQKTKVISLKNTQETIADALFFEKVDYVITIPSTFSKELSQKQQPKLITQVKPGNFKQVYVDSLINNYLSTYQFYQTAFPNKSTTALQQLTTNNIETTGRITFDSSYKNLKKNTVSGKIFATLAYTMFMATFSVIALTSLSFNRKEISFRNHVSPFSKRKFSRQQLLVQLSICLMLWFIFVAQTLFIAKSALNMYSVYFIMNTLLLFVVIVTFSNLLSGFIKSAEMLSVINNVVILGSSFLSGVFVPIDFLPDIVVKIASFTPIYWYVQNCTLIGNTIQFNQVFFSRFQFNALVLLTFACLFFLLTLLAKREHSIRAFA